VHGRGQGQAAFDVAAALDAHHLAAGAAADPEGQLAAVVAQAGFGHAVVADVVGRDGEELARVQPADGGQLGNQPHQIRGVDHQIAVQAHVSRRCRQLHLHREHAPLGDEIAQRAQDALVELVDRGVDRDGQAARHAGVNGRHHAIERTLLAEFVVLGLEAIQAEGRATKARRLGALDVACVPVPAVRDEVDLDAMIGQALADAIPIRVERGLAAAQGHAPAAERCQLVGHAQVLLQAHLVVAPATRERTAVLAAQIARKGQFPDAGSRRVANLLEDVDHVPILTPTNAVAGSCAMYMATT
jgi:hypothetical protein